MLPYRFRRRVSFRSSNRILLEYRVDNEGDHSFPFLWVAHPQFAVSEPTRILLPPAIEKMHCVFGGHTLEAGKSYVWHDCSLVIPSTTGEGRKFYYQEKVPAGWSGLFGQESGNFLILSVPPNKVPYIGVWIDEGMYNDRMTCALEPGIGYYDSLEMAEGNGTAQLIPAKDSFVWHLEILLGQGNSRDAIP